MQVLNEYVCDRCGKDIDSSMPTVVDSYDFAPNLELPGNIEGMELCGDCYDKFMGAQREAILEWWNTRGRA